MAAAQLQAYNNNATLIVFLGHLAKLKRESIGITIDTGFALYVEYREAGLRLNQTILCNLFKISTTHVCTFI